MGNFNLSRLTAAKAPPSHHLFSSVSWPTQQHVWSLLRSVPDSFLSLGTSFAWEGSFDTFSTSSAFRLLRVFRVFRSFWWLLLRLFRCLSSRIRCSCWEIFQHLKGLSLVGTLRLLFKFRTERAENATKTSFCLTPLRLKIRRLETNYSVFCLQNPTAFKICSAFATKL